MLRTLFVSAILVVGAAFALQSEFYALLLYLWFAYFRPEQWVWSASFQAFPISYVVGVYLVFRWILSGTALRADLRTGLLAALLLVAAIATFASPYYAYCLPYLSDFTKAIIITYMIATLASDTSRLRIVILTIAFSLAFEGAKQGWAQLILNPGGTNTNEVAFLGDNNGVAVGMLMLVAMIVSLARTSATVWERWLHHFLAVGILYRAVSTYSRGGFLAAAALLLMFLLRSPRRGRALVAAALAGSLVLSVMPEGFWDRMNTINTVEDENERDVSVESRLHFWSTALVMASARPMGVGVNGYNVAYDRYDSTDGAFGRERSVHSAWFGALAELGYAGFALFVTILAFAFTACWRTRRLAKRGLIPRELEHFAVGCEAALVAFAVGGSFVIFQYTEMLWHVVGLTMALYSITAIELAARKETGAAPALYKTSETAAAPAAASAT